MTFDRYCTAEANITYRTQVVWPSQVKTAIYPYETKRILKAEISVGSFFLFVSMTGIIPADAVAIGYVPVLLYDAKTTDKGIFCVCMSVCPTIYHYYDIIFL